MATSQPVHPLAPGSQRPMPKIDRYTYMLGEFMLKYWALFITVFLGLLVFTAISIPFLSYLGLDPLSKQLFFALHYICAQIPSHSFYIFGHQLGFCARNLAIYGSMFVGSLIFVLSKKRMPGLPWWLWILMLLPMAWDGTTQMFGLRESDWILRVITGTLFGLGNVWFALPFMEKTIRQDQLNNKLRSQA
ncbi:MAG: DUF2085 domain-containing protein [Ktedonobacteraceae bacterium]|jgi:uncharacterized membrane protein|nr:DUF2085 domain-containing protein [Ktedonobacteraceae bacterium]MBO0790308.1 DUF2085 domain-containing protein [Ktedonobacteraceae bacterium]